MSLLMGLLELLELLELLGLLGLLELLELRHYMKVNLVPIPNKNLHS